MQETINCINVTFFSDPKYYSFGKRLLLHTSNLYFHKKKHFSSKETICSWFFFIMVMRVIRYAT